MFSFHGNGAPYRRDLPLPVVDAVARAVGREAHEVRRENLVQRRRLKARFVLAGAGAGWALRRAAPKNTLLGGAALAIANAQASVITMTWLHSFCTAMAVRGACGEGFQIMVSPHTAANAAFQAQTATGKLKDVITPTTPSG